MEGSMKARPILFSAPMIRALRDGRKTQTRRIVKPQPFADDSVAGWAVIDRAGSIRRWHPALAEMDCPYGKPGDLLWVRENGWERPERTPQMMREGADTWAPYYYDADGLTDAENEQFKAWGFKRRPSIHMPRWASRITLRLTDVRVERLQDISIIDARAEGVREDRVVVGVPERDPRALFPDLWNSINGAGAWDINPWVWALSFDVILANVDQVLAEAA